MGKKVGIMGGTFNPIHNAHLAMAQDALEQFHLDEILFIPSGTPYLKDQRIVLPGKIRYEMVECAICDNPKFAISDIEVLREGNTYTYETILSLKEQNPDTTYYFIVGADSFFYMENWVCPEKIFGEAIVLVAVRDDVTPEALNVKIEEIKEKYNCEVDYLRFQANSLSSTYVRKCVEENRSIQYYVPSGVREYIINNHLYQTESDLTD